MTSYAFVNVEYDLAMIFYHFPALGGMEYASICKHSRFPKIFSTESLTSCTLHVFRNSIPFMWSRIDFHIDGSFLGEHKSFCQSKMVLGCCWSKELQTISVGTWMLLSRNTELVIRLDFDLFMAVNSLKTLYQFLEVFNLQNEAFAEVFGPKHLGRVRGYEFIK